MIIVHNNTFGKDWPLVPVIIEIDKLVETASRNVYNISAILDSIPKFYQWKYSAMKFIQKKIIDDFIYARYGYAVEEYTNLNMCNIHFPAGYTYNLQVEHGATRPDIVIYESGKEIAWLDITSEGSVNHIDMKSGTGWTKTPFVAELLYRKLELSNITLGSGIGIGKRALVLSALRHCDIERNKLLQYMVICTDKVLCMTYHETIYFNQLIDLFSRAFKYNFRNVYSPHSAIKSILQKYISYGRGSYTQTASEFIRIFYSSHSQNSSLANKIITESYHYTILTERNYLEQDEIDELLGD